MKALMFDVNFLTFGLLPSSESFGFDYKENNCVQKYFNNSLSTKALIGNANYVSSNYCTKVVTKLKKKIIFEYSEECW